MFEGEGSDSKPKNSPFIQLCSQPVFSYSQGEICRADKPFQMYPRFSMAEGAVQASLQPTITNTNTNFVCFHGHGAPETWSFIHMLLPYRVTSSPSLWGWGRKDSSHTPISQQILFQQGKRSRGGAGRGKCSCSFILSPGLFTHPTWLLVEEKLFG